MEYKFNFKSSVCTNKEQSERLLALGLKKETADMVYYQHWENAVQKKHDVDVLSEYNIPAWSLHRLIEMALRYILICGISFTFNEDAYEKVIGIIEHQIKERDFNKEYLNGTTED